MSGIQKVPFIGASLYNVIFPVVMVIQYVLDFSFLIINMIINDWWYALMLLAVGAKGNGKREDSLSQACSPLLFLDTRHL